MSLDNLRKLAANSSLPSSSEGVKARLESMKSELFQINQTMDPKQGSRTNSATKKQAKKTAKKPRKTQNKRQIPPSKALIDSPKAIAKSNSQPKTIRSPKIPRKIDSKI